MPSVSSGLSLECANRAPSHCSDDSERLARLRLARSDNVGSRTYAYLLSRFGTAAAALEAMPALAPRGYRSCTHEVAEAEMKAGYAAGATLLTIEEPAYPPLLAAVEGAPPAIWVLGRLHVLARPAVAVVGARNASVPGLRTARRITRGLATEGYVIVSGLARGIDRAAHEAAGEAGTIAVMAGGLDCALRPAHEALAGRIAATGALVSGCPMSIKPTRRHFARQSRLIAGLSEGVLLIEVGLGAGTLMTGRYALDQGRGVMACPGAAEDPRAGGCNRLIRDGAAPVRSAADVLRTLGRDDLHPNDS